MTWEFLSDLELSLSVASQSLALVGMLAAGSRVAIDALKKRMGKSTPVQHIEQAIDRLEDNSNIFYKRTDIRLTKLEKNTGEQNND